MACEPAWGGVRRSYRVLVHTAPEAWVGTMARTPVVTRPSGPHEVSKLSVTAARRSAERIGPTIIAAPHRGQAHVARGTVSAVTVGVASGDGAAGDGVASKVRASCCERFKISQSSGWADTARDGWTRASSWRRIDR
jgi:hypothetical protein